MSDAPTDGWRAHRAGALAIRALAVGLPAAVSVAVAVALGRALPPPPTLGWALARLAAILCGSTLVMFAVRLVTRRLLPLGMLLSLSLAFPDETPKRLKMALRAPSARRLREDLGQAGTAGLGRGAGDAAETMVGLIAAISAHHRLTRGHSERVRAYADLVAVELGLGARERDMVRWAALLHDLGKLTVPTAILDKQGRPDEREWAVLAAHPAASARLAQPLKRWMGEWWYGIGQHHEKWDGSGYPDGLAGDAISLSARIVALADSFETMTATRSYKRPMSIANAREELVRCAGSHFDPQVVRAFLNVGLGPLHRVAGLASWLPVPLINIVLPLRNTLAAAAGQATSAVAAGAVAVASVTLTAPPELLAAAPTTPVAASESVWTNTAQAFAQLATARIGRPTATTAARVAPSAPADPVSPTSGATAAGARIGSASSPGGPTGAAGADPSATGATAGTPVDPGRPAGSAATAAPPGGAGAGPGDGSTPATPVTPATPAPPPTDPTTRPPTTPPPTTAAGALTVAGDTYTDLTPGPHVIRPLENDRNYDATTLRVKTTPPDVAVVVNLLDHSIAIVVPSGRGGESRTFVYQVCDRPGGTCRQGTVQLKFKG